MASAVTSTSDLQVTYEDQSKINRFACHNSKLEEIKEELVNKEKELKNIEESIGEMDLYSTLNDDEGFNIMEGEMFVHFTGEEALEWVNKKKEELSREVSTMKDEVDRLREEMNNLKTDLYAKFGRNNINLEADEQ
ncbi:prefoldin subunit 4-like [Panonychus citri]|uniref:prefoldin subunit 4-like n=1 Tax=Panonychus citri TaxID=50023 RepID=UPI0023079292|nr:prefoldin subunit 4-like [Panonychus citri]